MLLDRAWIEKHIPHHGSMCLLDAVIEWDSQHIRCRSATHRLPDHPLRSQGRLGAACGIEYAAQAMAVHGALAGGTSAHSVPSGGESRDAPGARPEAGFLASVRAVRLHVLWLDDIEADLICDATRIAGDAVTALYEFALWSEAHRLLSGRATVVLDGNKRLNM
jgi:predicted hotdog family 3-hydroxylacyl-ACP dehydratase